MKRRYWIWLMVICGMFAIISAYQCLTVPFEGDEHIPCILGTSSFESNGCLYYYVFNFISSAWDEYRFDYRNRLLSWGLGLASILILFWVGRSIKDSFTGLLVAFMLAANVSHLAAASYHRFYTANECCTILATGLCLWACRGQSWSRWGWYLLAMMAAIASMLLSVPLLLIHCSIVFLTSPQRSVALKRFAWVALLCCLFWGLLVYLDREGYDRFQYCCDFKETSVATISYVMLSYGASLNCAVDSRSDFNVLQILKWLTLLAGIGIWRLSRSAAWKNLARVKLALVVGLVCITALLIVYSLSIKNLVSETRHNVLWLIPYVVLILGLAMRTYRVFRIAMLTAILLASPVLSSMTTLCDLGANNEIVRFAMSHLRVGEVMVLSNQRAVSLPVAWKTVLNVPQFRDNEPGVVIIAKDVKGFIHTLFWADTMPWRRIWFITQEKRELEQYLGNGNPVRLGNHSVCYLRAYRDEKTDPDIYDLYYIIIEPLQRVEEMN